MRRLRKRPAEHAALSSVAARAVVRYVLAFGLVCATLPCRASTLPAAQASDTTVITVTAPLYRGGGTLIDDLILGAGSDATEYQLSEILGLAIGADGALYVVDRAGNSYSVRKYDAAGKYVRSFGRAGSGPGEFQAPGAVAELADGRVLVSDIAGIVSYSPSGEPLTRLRSQSSMIPGPPIWIDPSGLVMVYTRRRPVGQMSLQGPMTPHAIRMSLDGKVVDTLANPADEFPAPPSVKIATVGPGGAASVRSAGIPFSPRHIVGWSPLGYFITSYTNRYAIDLRVPRKRSIGQQSPWRPGDPVLSIRRDVPPVAVNRSERDDWRQDVAMYMRRSAPLWSWDGVSIPAVKPAIRDFWVAQDGRIWIQLSQPALLNPDASIPSTPGGREGVGGAARRRWVEPYVYDILEPDGRYVGQLRMPAGISPLAARGDYIWARLRDVNGVPILKRFRIVWRR